MVHKIFLTGYNFARNGCPEITGGGLQIPYLRPFGHSLLAFTPLELLLQAKFQQVGQLQSAKKELSSMEAPVLAAKEEVRLLDEELAKTRLVLDKKRNELNRKNERLAKINEEIPT